GLLGALKSGNVDMVVAGMSPTEERKKAVDFTDVYYNGENAILLKKDDVAKYTTIEDLKELKIGAQKSSIQESFAKDVIEATNIKSLSKISDVILELKNGNVDAVVVSKEAVKGYLEKYPELSYSNIDLGEDTAEGSAIAISKSEDDSLVDEVNKVLKKLIDEGKIDQFVEEATKLAQE
ncbi:MAG: transporter substrate-binding domain-containing protein, partial [Peptostreptococcaceae bacterium]